MTASNNARLLLDIFGGNAYHGVGKINAETGNVWYDPVSKELTASLLEDHINGKIALASYPIQIGDNTVRYMAWDIDAAGNIELAREMTREVLKVLKDQPYAVEFSGGKGYHIFLFFTAPVAASLAKTVGEWVRDQAHLPKSEGKDAKGHVEVFPKQEKLGTSSSKRKSLGNCLKIPLGQHPRTHKWSVFVDPENGWEDGPILEPEDVLSLRITPSELQAIKQEVSTDRAELLIKTLTEYWGEGKRHQLALFLSGYMAAIGWTMELAKDVIYKIATGAGDPEPEDRMKTVEDTFRKAMEGQVIAGYSRLGEILPGGVMAVITRLIPEMAEPDMVRSVEKIRLGKGDGWLKVQAVIKLLWSDLCDRGKFLTQPIEGTAYWFNNETHLLTRVDSEKWLTQIYHDYHINMAETFYRQVEEGLTRMALSEGKPVEIRRRTVWDGKKLYINLGGEEVYILDGKEIYIDYNGECGCIFHSNEDTSLVVIPDFEGPQVDAWEFLVEGINFIESGRAPIQPEEQKELLKAWILASFFKEAMPTRPILTLLGEAGSGKTTAARRILRILEGPQEDVIQALMDKPDSWRASISEHHVLVLDNLEKSGARWMVDSLNLIATGAHIELRKLYHTNELFKVRPDCWVILTAVNMPFPDETLISRLLVLDLQKLTTYIPEHEFRYKLGRNLRFIWADLLIKLNSVVATLRTNTEAKLVSSLRLADFAIFCKRIENCGLVNPVLLDKGLTALGSSQMQALARAEHNVVPVLEEYLRTKPREASKEHTMAELIAILQPIAILRKHSWRWSTPQGLWGHINAMQGYLVQEMGANFGKRYNDITGRDENVISFPHLADAEEPEEPAKVSGTKSI
jgi:ABC-type dipeptide/oligopeptide/nickel transport system ATPase component